MNIISSMATRQVLTDLLALYEATSGQRMVLEAVGGVDAAKRVRAGEAVDAVVLAANVIDELAREGHLVAGSRADLVRSGVAIAVRTGAPRPAIASEDDVKRAVLGARSLSCSTGPSGLHLAKLFDRWGVAEQIKGRIVQAPPGVPVGSLVAKGEIELGFQQLSELMHFSGIDVLGPLPDAIQIVTTFSAGLSATSAQGDAVRRLINFLVSPAAEAAKRHHGMEPAA